MMTTRDKWVVVVYVVATLNILVLSFWMWVEFIRWAAR